MSAEVFLDTTVLLYLFSKDSSKADRAELLIAEGGMISVQVLNEFCSVARRKLDLNWDEIEESLTIFRSTCVVHSITLETHDLGRSLAKRHDFAIYDAMIISAALLAGCTSLLSEDMQHGQLIENQLTITNPFR